MRSIALILAFVLLFGSAAKGKSYRPEDVANVHLADSTRYVANPDGVLSAEAVNRLDAMLGDVWRATTAEPVVVAVDDIDSGWDENQFANELFDLWGIGKKDTQNGLLVLLVKNRRRIVARTGRGLGGILPDALCGRILKDKTVPYFKKDDYDGGVEAAVKVFAQAMTSPEAAEEIRSKYGNNASGRDVDEMDPFTFMLYCGGVMGVVMLVWVLVVIFSSRGKDEQERYRRLNNIRPVALFLSFAGLGFPLPAYLLCWLVMNRLRNHPRRCPNCDAEMRKLDEVHDNDYLTPAQDLEEQLNSIDYDVWLCDRCGEKDVIPYVNRQSAYSVCEQCGARTCTLSSNRIIVQPTQQREGRGEKAYLCRNCNKLTVKPYKIAKLASAPVVILPGGGFGSGGRSGFGGGSFGGGGTSGGGASVGW